MNTEIKLEELVYIDLRNELCSYIISHNSLKLFPFPTLNPINTLEQILKFNAKFDKVENNESIFKSAINLLKTCKVTEVYISEFLVSNVYFENNFDCRKFIISYSSK